MAVKTKIEIYCCLECGRDTTRDCQICSRCMPKSHEISYKDEQRGRKIISISSSQSAEGMNFGDMDNDDRPLRNDLVSKEYGNFPEE
ncbi:MAG TPA: hypothetical protein VMX17_13195 [Candidatus Glassbacteria bacterium]|nr:hypothetical protein [Candidatus Glassbacteria bacterium]